MRRKFTIIRKGHFISREKVVVQLPLKNRNVFVEEKNDRAQQNEAKKYLAHWGETIHTKPYVIARKFGLTKCPPPSPPHLENKMFHH